MRCEPCHGLGKIEVEPYRIEISPGVFGMATWVICSPCGGTGVVSCCDGTERQLGADDVDVPGMSPAVGEDQ